jgi:glycerophosphoryl diester phosphodiesterase
MRCTRIGDEPDWIRMTSSFVATLGFAFVLATVAQASDPVLPFIVQSHRGAGVLAPENTIAAFELGWKLGTIPEADVRTTKDGVIVAFHDADFSRVVHGATPEQKKQGVKDVTFAELSALEVGAEGGSGFERRKVSSMADIFAVMQGKPERRLYLDIKQVSLPALAKLVEQHEVAPQVILASTDMKVIHAWKSLLPASNTLHWMGGSEASLRQRMEVLKKEDFRDITQIQIHVRQPKGSTGWQSYEPSEAFLREVGVELKPRKILFQALPWGADTPDIYRKLLSLGVESFATDHPDVLMPVMQEHLK